MKTVAANVQKLTEWNRSMAFALEKAENGGSEEDEMYFIKKLRQSAAVLGYSLTLCKPPKEQPLPERPSGRGFRLTAKGVER